MQEIVHLEIEWEKIDGVESIAGLAACAVAGHAAGVRTVRSVVVEDAAEVRANLERENDELKRRINAQREAINEVRDENARLRLKVDDLRAMNQSLVEAGGDEVAWGVEVRGGISMADAHKVSCETVAKAAGGKVVPLFRRRLILTSAEREAINSAMPHLLFSRREALRKMVECAGVTVREPDNPYSILDSRSNTWRECCQAWARSLKDVVRLEPSPNDVFSAKSGGGSNT